MKLNNKGFTLVELLAVIVLLAVITTIAVPSIMSISKKTKENMLETKVDLILQDAKLYGEDRLNAIAGSTTKYNTYSCSTVTFEELLKSGYITSDEDDDAAGYIVNPVDNSNMNSKKIILYIKNKRIVTVMADENLDGTEENSCS